MTFRLGPSICVILTVFICFLSLLTFVGVPKFTITQDRSRLLGYPTWHPPIKGRNDNKSDSALFFTTLLMAITCYLGARWTAHPPTTRKLQTYFISDDSAPVSAYYFNRHLVIYNFITTFTMFAVIILDLGKLWATIGILHNTIEFAILVLIGSGGRLKNISFYGVLLSYAFFVYCGVLLIDWPYDAVWFKIQGLCFDYALMIIFIRIYFNTKHELKHGDGAEHIMPSILSSLTYGITFPAYMYYVYVDTHSTSIYPTKRIYLPSTPGWKKFVIGTIAFSCSVLTMRFGAYLQARNHQDDGNLSAIYY
ncbi:38682_t:CDS:2 [Gigaspora margarita]|uniref:38682_t:CDS:1 n=1 Tax=Gigaspora margarita TaxID=4874 RepID=A0ABN7VEZ8_GIGMA|nr:38682_t:CDS:2 [Gigaspora margarita]